MHPLKKTNIVLTNNILFQTKLSITSVNDKNPITPSVKKRPGRLSSMCVGVGLRASESGLRISCYFETGHSITFLAFIELADIYGTWHPEIFHEMEPVKHVKQHLPIVNNGLLAM